MEIILNGQHHPLDTEIALETFITELALPAHAMAIAVNRTVIRRHDWSRCILQANDRVDIVKAIGGG